MTIYLDDICKSYNGINVLKDISISIEDGKCYAFTGDKECGKTTLLNIFMGLIKPDSGKVSRMGDYKYPNLRTAYVSQNDCLNAKKNAVWNVKKAHRTASKGRAIEELSKFLSEDEYNCPISELTPGQRRIVEIIKALFVPADFIVLDEPFRGMSQDQKDQILKYILNLLGTRPILLASRKDPEIKGFRVIDLS
ncbi:MAG: ATP-binding cassette domain-containing protein [Lachnospiraceae bacterium]|nr:ATP-binding cassette domain-containing protein [Lachnospiraceae bacterium]